MFNRNFAIALPAALAAAAVLWWLIYRALCMVARILEAL